MALDPLFSTCSDIAGQKQKFQFSSHIMTLHISIFNNVYGVLGPSFVPSNTSFHSYGIVIINNYIYSGARIHIIGPTIFLKQFFKRKETLARITSNQSILSITTDIYRRAKIYISGKIILGSRTSKSKVKLGNKS